MRKHMCTVKVLFLGHDAHKAYLLQEAARLFRFGLRCQKSYITEAGVRFVVRWPWMKRGDW